jgi:pilus assembly protein FimV
MMSRKLMFLGLVALILAPGAALSLGLGEIRLNSYLNQPMNAEIALSLSSRAELDSLRVELASLESFQRYGLERPAYFDDLRFQVRPTGPTSAVVQVTSTRPMVEPFLTFLVEARWSGGRILREYTLLLDPPVFLPTPEPETLPTPAPAPAPVVERPSPAAPPAPVGRPAPVAAPPAAPREFGPEYGPVQRNETLWNIAQRVRPDDGLTTNQVMVALFRANPGAFDGNINRLRAGAILRVPSREQIAATSVGEANSEVSSQNQAWRGAQPVAAPADRRLELAPPTEAPRVPAADPAVAAVPSRELLDAVQELRGELAETRRLVELRDAEIAALQARLAELEADSAAVAPVASTPETVEPAPAEAAPAPEPTPAPAPAAEVETRAPAPPPPPPAPSLVERALGLLGSLWLWLALAAILVAGAVMVFLRKRSDVDDSLEKDLAETGSWGVLETPQSKAAAAAAAAAGGAAARRSQRAETPSEILVEETASAVPREAVASAAPAPVAAAPSPPPATQPVEKDDEDYRYPFEDTIAGEAGINLDQSDPLAEADFHMAYGLYDQAAEIIKKAVEREPDRYDLRRKLLDICFVWGNAGEFLAQARAIRELPGEVSGGDWAKVAIMGRQICPGEALFEGGQPAATVDLDLSSEEPGQTPGATDTAASGSWLDFDVGGSESSVEALGDTREQQALDLSSMPLAEQTAELDLEELGIDLDLGETGEHALKDLAELAPELEELLPPALEQAPDEAIEQEDAGGTQVMEAAPFVRRGEDPTQREEGFEVGEDDPTLSGLGDFEVEGDLEAEEASDQTLVREGQASLVGESEAVEDDADQTVLKQFAPPGEMQTTEVDVLEGEELDLNLDDLTQMLQSPQGASAPSVDDATRLATAIEESGFTESHEDESATRKVATTSDMTEVGTKLDLARAYIDMGDPEGARSILEEVVEEGNEAQQEEARELLGSLR